jgi:Tfp pilus assembly protein PilE
LTGKVRDTMKKTLQFLGFKKTKTRKKFDYYFIKGFTLVEIIGAIVLLTVIGLIIYPVINNLISDSKDDLYKKQIEELERISNTWVAKNYKKLKLEAGYSYNLSFEELKEAGLISEQHIKNPKTGELLEGCITLSYNSENKNYDIKYAPEC